VAPVSGRGLDRDRSAGMELPAALAAGRHLRRRGLAPMTPSAWTSLPRRLVSRRNLRALGARLLPEALQRRIRGRFYGHHDARVSLPVDFSQDGRGPLLVLDGRIRLSFPEDERWELEHHLAGAQLEETSGVIAFATSTRTLFDVGAATAFYSRLFCACGPDHRAVAFEPSPAQLQIARTRIAHAGYGARIQLRSCAVGQTPGRADMFVAESGFAGIESSAAECESIDVEITTLDHEVERLGVRPDLLKIDVEGLEHEVLIGARRLLASHKPPICLELHLGLLERRGISPRHVVEELLSHGYRFRTYHGLDLCAADVWDSMHAVLRLIAW
jgi:FkbM family methyltransferase